MNKFIEINLTLNTLVYAFRNDTPAIAVGKYHCLYTDNYQVVVRLFETSGSHLAGTLLPITVCEVVPQEARITNKNEHNPVFYEYIPYRALWGELPEYEYTTDIPTSQKYLALKPEPKKWRIGSQNTITGCKIWVYDSKGNPLTLTRKEAIKEQEKQIPIYTNNINLSNMIVIIEEIDD